MTMPSVSPAVVAVCRAHNADIDLIHARIYGFLDVSPQWTLADAAAAGHLRLVQRLSPRTPQDHDDAEDAMDLAAEYGHLEIVQWLHAHRHEGSTTDAMDLAAARGHLHVVQWLHANTDAGCTTDAMDLAAKYGHLHVVQWLHTHARAGCTSDAMDGAAAKSHLRVLQWLHRHRDEGCSDTALVDASYSGHVAVVKWLLMFRREGRVGDAIASAATRGHDELVAWLLRHTYLRDPSPPLAMVATAAFAKQPALAWATPSDAEWAACAERALVL